MILYRPVGLKELELIVESDFSRFPPRLPTQPIFYPVLNYDYAVQIARDWNTKDEGSGYAGFVLQFNVEDEYVKAFLIQTVGNTLHQELWIPSEELHTFNQHITGKITVEAAFYGSNYVDQGGDAV